MSDDLANNPQSSPQPARDYSFEALAEVTGTDWNTGRGELNTALKLIREESGIEDSYLLADEIHVRARLYRGVMPEVMLTPTALAKHWRRVSEEANERRKVKGTNLSVDKQCATCGGDRFVVVSLRKPQTSEWMHEHGIKAVEDEMIEEMAPCPDCNAQVIEMRRHDGTVIRTQDPGRVREMMSR